MCAMRIKARLSEQERARTCFALSIDYLDRIVLAHNSQPGSTFTAFSGGDGDPDVVEFSPTLDASVVFRCRFASSLLSPQSLAPSQTQFLLMQPLETIAKPFAHANSRPRQSGVRSDGHPLSSLLSPQSLMPLHTFSFEMQPSPQRLSAYEPSEWPPSRHANSLRLQSSRGVPSPGHPCSFEFKNIQHHNASL